VGSFGPLFWWNQLNPYLRGIWQPRSIPFHTSPDPNKGPSGLDPGYARSSHKPNARLEYDQDSSSMALFRSQNFLGKILVALSLLFGKIYPAWTN
jgi:hypothetical protein